MTPATPLRVSAELNEQDDDDEEDGTRDDGFERE